MQSETRVETASFGQKVSGWPARIKNYVEELQAEMRRVTWPSWKQVRATTTVVIVAVFGFAAYFALVDLAITKLITRIFDAFTK
ncbi:MAG TPA: preprotein translocase subunit SecE [Bryobacteraceae bacterium]|nr:preprotein translocase subunit SecE [Bryobacteraceae bacterium]